VIYFSHFPVLEEGVYIGSIAAEDIETLTVTKKSRLPLYIGGFLLKQIPCGSMF
jgi:predicted transcriptional regulator